VGDHVKPLSESSSINADHRTTQVLCADGPFVPLQSTRDGIDLRDSAVLLRILVEASERGRALKKVENSRVVGDWEVKMKQASAIRYTGRRNFVGIPEEREDCVLLAVPGHSIIVVRDEDGRCKVVCRKSRVVVEGDVVALHVESPLCVSGCGGSSTSSGGGADG